MRKRGISETRVARVENIAEEAIARARLRGLSETADRVLAQRE